MTTFTKTKLLCSSDRDLTSYCDCLFRFRSLIKSAWYSDFTPLFFITTSIKSEYISFRIISEIGFVTLPHLNLFNFVYLSLSMSESELDLALPPPEDYAGEFGLDNSNRGNLVVN